MTLSTTRATAPDVRLLRCIEEWARARENRLIERRAMEGFRCEYEEHGEWEVGDGGVPRCYRNSMPKDEWCSACQQRDPHFQRMVQLKHIERNYFRGLCSLIDRRTKAASRSAQEPPKEELDANPKYEDGRR